MDPLVIGVVLVIVILLIIYFVQPIIFEKYVLMNIPEYSALKSAVGDSANVLIELKSKLEKIKKLGGTEAEILASQREIVDLNLRIASLRDQSVKNTKKIADLKSNLDKTTAKSVACKKLQAKSTKHLKELNDTLITDFKFRDKELAQRLQATRDTLILIMAQGKDIICENKHMMIFELIKKVKEMKSNIVRTNSLCDIDNRMEIKKFMRANVERMIRGKGPMSTYIIKLYGDLESVISYIISNKFCDKELVFRVDLFEKTVKGLINGMCKSNDWKKATSVQLEYLLMKPATYLPGES